MCVRVCVWSIYMSVYWVFNCVIHSAVLDIILAAQVEQAEQQMSAKGFLVIHLRYIDSYGYQIQTILM